MGWFTYAYYVIFHHLTSYYFSFPLFVVWIAQGSDNKWKVVRELYKLNTHRNKTAARSSISNVFKAKRKRIFIKGIFMIFYKPAQRNCTARTSKKLFEVTAMWQKDKLFSWNKVTGKGHDRDIKLYMMWGKVDRKRFFSTLILESEVIQSNRLLVDSRNTKPCASSPNV